MDAYPPARRSKRPIYLLTRFDRRLAASSNVTDLRWIRRIYAQAIVFGGESAELSQGLVQAVLVGIIGICVRSGYSGWTLLVDPDKSNRSLGVIIFLGCATFGLLLLAWGHSITFFLPGDNSVVFDRRNRYVHWVTMDRARATRLTTLGPMPMRVVSVSWAQIDVEHRIFRAPPMGRPGSISIGYNHDLVFVVHRSATDPTIVEEFGVVPHVMLGWETAPDVYEHIRRYMEDGGPPLPPGVTELPPIVPKPRNWWQSMGLVGPFGPKYREWWEKQPGFTLAVHLLFPITIPFYLLWSLFNWLSYATEQKVVWPQKVLDTLGPVLTDDEVRAGKGGKLVA